MILARLLSATPQTDGEHWDLAFRWHQDVWHTDKYAQNPAPYQRNPQLSIPNRPPYPWMPATEAFGGGGDALFPNAPAKFSFGVVINAANSPPTLDILGDTPINAPPSGFAPQCPLEATVSATGGSIVSGTYLIAIAASVSGPVSQYFIRAVIPAGITTGSIVISGVVWQAAAPAIGVFMGTNSLNMQRISNGAWTGSGADTYGNPTVFTIALGTNDSEGLGLPDPVFNSFLFQVKDIIHGGVWGAAANAYGTSGGNVSITFATAAFAINQWAGYILSIYSVGPLAGFVIPVSSMILSNTADTIVLNVISLGLFPPVGTVFVMRAKASSITATTIGDPNFINFYGPAGLAVNKETGNLLRIIAGTGAGQPPIPIASNTATVLTLMSPWAVTPDSTSTYIVEAPLWKYSLPTATVVAASLPSSPSAFKVASIPMLDLQAKALLIEGLTVDVNGNWSVERYAPLREIYVPAAANTALNPGYVTITPVAGLATIDLANGPLSSYLTILDGTATDFAPIVFTGGSISPGMVVKLFLLHDATTTVRACPAFSNAAGGFVSNTQALIAALLVDGPSLFSEIIFTCQPGGLWSPGSIASNISST